MSRVLSEAATNREIATFPAHVAARWRKAAAGLAALLAAATLLAPVSAQATTVSLGVGNGPMETDTSDGIELV
jgi:Na+/proline symporter